MKILIIIPTLNEEKNVEIIYKKIRENIKNYNILFIDDNSTDLTRNQIKWRVKFTCTSLNWQLAISPNKQVN